MKTAVNQPYEIPAFAGMTRKWDPKTPEDSLDITALKTGPIVSGQYFELEDHHPGLGVGRQVVAAGTRRPAYAETFRLMLPIYSRLRAGRRVGVKTHR